MAIQKVAIPLPYAKVGASPPLPSWPAFTCDALVMERPRCTTVRRKAAATCRTARVGLKAAGR